MKKSLLLAASVGFLASCGGGSQEPAQTMDPPTVEETKAEAPNPLFIPEGAEVFFVNLKDGDILTSPVHVEMGVNAFTVMPAGKIEKGTGHHHLVINDGPAELGVVVPADDTHIHFGGGQTETDVELAPGEYQLTLQFANGVHQSYGLPLSKTITVTIK